MTTTALMPRQAGLPALITGAGEHASPRYIEFFTAQIRNKSTRKAYLAAMSAGWELPRQGRHRVNPLGRQVPALLLEKTMRALHVVAIVLAIPTALLSACPRHTDLANRVAVDRGHSLPAAEKNGGSFKLAQQTADHGSPRNAACRHYRRDPLHQGVSFCLGGCNWANALCS